MVWPLSALPFSLKMYNCIGCVTGTGNQAIISKFAIASILAVSISSQDNKTQVFIVYQGSDVFDNIPQKQIFSFLKWNGTNTIFALDVYVLVITPRPSFKPDLAKKCLYWELCYKPFATDPRLWKLRRPSQPLSDYITVKRARERVKLLQTGNWHWQKSQSWL